MNGIFKLIRVSDNAVLISEPFTILPRKDATAPSTSNIEIPFARPLTNIEVKASVEVDENDVDFVLGSNWLFTATEFVLNE